MGGYTGSAVALLLVTLYSNCSAPPVDVVFYRSDDYRFTRAERRLIEGIAEQAVADVRALLPDLPPFLILRVQAGPEVLESTGDNAGRATPNVVYWTVDPDSPGGVRAVAQASLRRSLFLHLYGLAREAALGEPRTVLTASLDFGLATMFARDSSGDEVPWATYPRDAATWVGEVAALPDDADFTGWMDQHRDGRRNVGPQAGKLLADEAIRRSGRSAAELVSTPAAAILEIATAGVSE